MRALLRDFAIIITVWAFTAYPILWSVERLAAHLAAQEWTR